MRGDDNSATQERNGAWPQVRRVHEQLRGGPIDSAQTWAAPAAEPEIKTPKRAGCCEALDELVDRVRGAHVHGQFIAVGDAHQVKRHRMQILVGVVDEDRLWHVLIVISLPDSFPVPRGDGVDGQDAGLFVGVILVAIAMSRGGSCDSVRAATLHHWSSQSPQGSWHSFCTAR